MSAGAGARYDGRTAVELQALLDLSRVVVYDEVPSTQDVAHAFGESGAPAGTLVLADAQSAGRGRGSNTWQSSARAGIWLTMLERPQDPAAIGVLSLRLALRMAPVLERWTAAPIRIKWPNDLLVGERKLAGVLTEARWRGARLDWVAIGVGINVVAPEGLDATSLVGVTDRCAVLGELLPALRAAAASGGVLSTAELERYAERDAVRGRRCREPMAGTAGGITPDGALIILAGDGEHAVRSGSLVLEEHS
jgi:BirA family biotin operon repressor/biotin-[acetyl-CoA-carboxylase] ligase